MFYAYRIAKDGTWLESELRLGEPAFEIGEIPYNFFISRSAIVSQLPYVFLVADNTDGGCPVGKRNDPYPGAVIVERVNKDIPAGYVIAPDVNFDGRLRSNSRGNTLP